MEKSAAFHSPKRAYRDDTIEKSDQKELANRSANISPTLTESNLSKFTQKRHSGNLRNPQNLDVIHERISGERILKPTEIQAYKASPKQRKVGHFSTQEPLNLKEMIINPGDS